MRLSMITGRRSAFILLLLFLTVSATYADTSAPVFDVLIRGGDLYDGSGDPPVRADVAIIKDRIAAIGDLANAGAHHVVHARSLAVAPGFINMLSWSNESLIADGRGQS